MSFTTQEQTIALAGIFQAGSLVQQIARRGMADSDAMRSSIHSLFQINAHSVVDVYGDINGIAHGLRELYRQLNGEVRRDNELTGYLLSLIQLERKLANQSDKLDQIQEGIKQTHARLTHFPELHTNILASLAEIYVKHISNLQPRIMVSGEPVYLQNPDNVDKIRSLLLAGIRAAVLWRQTGGRRYQLLISRKKYIDTAKKMLNQPV